MKNDVVGTRVRINGTLTENTFATKELKIARNEQLQVGWISLNNVPEEDSADTTIAGKIYNIVDEMDGDVETGNKIVILHYGVIILIWTNPSRRFIRTSHNIAIVKKLLFIFVTRKSAMSIFLPEWI